MNKRLGDKKMDNDGLFIPVRHVALLVAGALLTLSIVFFAGYFVGKKHVMEQFVDKFEQDSFADQVYSSLCELYDCDIEQTECVASQKDVSLEAHDGKSEDLLVSPISSIESTYKALLIGYQSKRYADAFVTKLQRKNIPAEMKVRNSSTARGKTKEWYQVVVGPYTDRDELQSVVDCVSREEKIKGARIVAC